MGNGLLAGVSPLLKKTCAALVGCDARSPGQIATAEGKSLSAIYMRRRRLERRIGITLPRLHRVGRPIAAIADN